MEMAKVISTPPIKPVKSFFSKRLVIEFALREQVGAFNRYNLLNLRPNPQGFPIPSPQFNKLLMPR
jgi:hypothetical protein